MQQEVQLMKRIQKIEDEVKEMRAHMADIDSIMTEEDYEALLAYRQEKSGGKLTSHTELLKELGQDIAQSKLFL